MRYPGLDLLRGLAAFGIVGRHLGLLPTTAAGMACLHFTDTNVAVFGAVSGFLMAESVKKGGSYFDFVKSRCCRLLPAYCFWTAVFVVMTMVFDLLFDGGQINPKFRTFGYWRSAIFFGTSSTHLWYVAWLFYWGIVLRLLWQLVRCWFVSLPLALASLCQAAFVAGDFNYYAVRLLAFMLLGLAFHDVRHVLSRMSWNVWLVLTFAALAAHALFATWNTTFLFDGAIVIPLLALCVRPNIRETTVGTWLGRMSFGVYLVHPLFAVGCAWLIKRTWTVPFGAQLLLGEWIVVMLLSTMVAYSMMFMGRRIRLIGSIC